MKYGIYLSLLFLLLVQTSLLAQKQNVYFLKNNGKVVNSKDSADFIRIIREPDSATSSYNVLEYYKSGKLRMTGKSVTIEPVTLDGRCTNFYEDGHKQSECTYKANVLIGNQYSFYPNGQTKEQRLYPDTIAANTHGNTNRSYRILSLYDTAGKILVTDGNGYYKTEVFEPEDIIEEGHVVNGLKDGLWKGRDKRQKLSFQEEYANGHLIKGVATSAVGYVTEYKSVMQDPCYKGGINAFYTFLSNHIRYPEHARRYHIEGRAVINFVVEKDGSLTDVFSVSNVDPELEAEAVRVVKVSKQWVPGQLYGCNVRVQYTVPIIFTLR